MNGAHLVGIIVQDSVVLLELQRSSWGNKIGAQFVFHCVVSTLTCPVPHFLPQLFKPSKILLQRCFRGVDIDVHVAGRLSGDREDFVVFAGGQLCSGGGCVSQHAGVRGQSHQAGRHLHTH